MVTHSSDYEQLLLSIHKHMEQNGLECRNELILDGSIHRYASRIHKDKDEWYLGFQIEGNHFVCIYGSWRTGDKFIYKSYSDGMIKDEESKLAIIYEKIAIEQSQEQEKRKKEALSIWKSAFPVYKHPYLEKKKVTGLTLKQYGAHLIVPYYNIDKELVSLQKIDPDGSKRFLGGIKTTGLFHPIGNYEDSETIVFCEGYATSDSVHSLLKIPTICCGSANNIVLVGKIFSVRFPNKKLILGTDNDEAGLKSVEQWKSYVSRHIAIPKEKDKDFNDIISVADGDKKKEITKLFFPPYAKSIELKSFLNLEVEKELWYNDILKKGSFNVIFGSAGVGKSRLACEMGFCLATKEDFLRYKTFNKGKVVYVDGEMTTAELQIRLVEMCNRYHDAEIDPEFFSILSSQTFYKENEEDLDLFNDSHRFKLSQIFEDKDIIILDNYGCLINLPQGENYKIDIIAWKKFFTWIKKYKELGKTILLVMHANKSGNLQGIGQIRNDADLVMEIRKPIDIDKQSLLHFEVLIDKGRSIPENKKEPFSSKLQSNPSIKSHNWISKTL